MSPTFNMKDLSMEVAEQFGLSGQGGAEVVRFVFDRIKDEVAAGKQVRLHKFGTLQVRERNATLARNPKTGEQVEVPACRVPKMTVSPHFKAMLEG